jgi:hypothetical protein
MPSNAIVKPLNPRRYNTRSSSKQLISAKANIDNVSASELHVAREELEAAKAKIDRLTRELEIEQVRRCEAEAMCRDAAVKLYSQRQSLVALREENTEIRSKLISVTAEREELIEELIDEMKELTFSRSLLANNEVSVREDSEERTRVEKRTKVVRFTDFVDVSLYDRDEPPQSVSEGTVEQLAMKVERIRKVTRFHEFVDILEYEVYDDNDNEKEDNDTDSNDDNKPESDSEHNDNEEQEEVTSKGKSMPDFDDDDINRLQQ